MTKHLSRFSNIYKKQKQYHHYPKRNKKCNAAMEARLVLRTYDVLV